MRIETPRSLDLDEWKAYLVALNGKPGAEWARLAVAAIEKGPSVILEKLTLAADDQEFFDDIVRRFAFVCLRNCKCHNLLIRHPPGTIMCVEDNEFCFDKGEQTTGLPISSKTWRDREPLL